MTLDIFSFLFPGVIARLNLILANQEIHMTTMAELATQIAAVTAQVDKARAEVIQKIADLQAALDAGGTITPEVEAAMAALKAAAQAADDVVVDPPL